MTAIDTRLADDRLAVFGAFHPNAQDHAPRGCKTLVLIGPREPGFWPMFTQSPEYSDRAPDPLDRWSKRVIGAHAAAINGQAIFPSDGPPYPTFYDWALRSGRAWRSPVAMLVHETAGLMVSYRGAIALPQELPLPAAPRPPCADCDTQPCRTACPVDALSDQYDVQACHDWLGQAGGQACMKMGCGARRACPISKTYGRMPAQSAFHMAAFYP